MRKTTQLSESKRENIVTAAILEFREQGFLGANMTRIAKRADVSSRTLYKHFESKDALFSEISDIMIERNHCMEPVPYDPQRDFAEQLKDALWRYMDVITDETAIGLNRMVLSELIRDLDRSRKFFAETETHDYPIKRLIAEAMEAGVIHKEDPAYATDQLLGLVKSFLYWPEFFLGQGNRSKKVMDDCVALFLAYYDRDR
ncbi:MAG: TetR/AcrR family transcriptional regulator [Paracoccaceae bacterium]